MAATDPGPSQLDRMLAHRLARVLGLRPGERVLCLGLDGQVASLAADAVGPAGQLVRTDYRQAVGSGSLPFADGEFDAVLSEVAVPVGTNLAPILTEVGRVTAPTGRVAFAAVSPQLRGPTPRR